MKAIKICSLETGVKVATNKAKRKASSKIKGKDGRYTEQSRTDDAIEL